MHWAPVPRVRADIGLTRTQKDVRRRMILFPQVLLLLLQFLQHLLFPQTEFLQDRYLKGEGQHPGAASSDEPRPPGLGPPLGVFSDVSVPRERPDASLQKPKEPIAPMLQNHARLRNLVELVKLHLKHYHMSPAQFEHRTSNLHLPEDVHELSKDVVQGCQHCFKNKGLLCKHSKVTGLRADNFGDIVFH